MARNSLSPGFLRIKYTSNGHNHVMTLPVNPSTPAGAGTQLIDSSAALQLWTSAVADIVLILKALLKTTDTISSAEIWTQATPTSVPIFQASTTVGVNGTSAAATVPWSQLAFSFRTTAGGRAKFVVLEGVNAVDFKYAAPLYSGNAAMQAVDTYLTGASSVVWGRDNHYIASGIQAVTKTNDALRKKYLNP